MYDFATQIENSRRPFIVSCCVHTLLLRFSDVSFHSSVGQTVCQVPDSTTETGFMNENCFKHHSALMYGSSVGQTMGQILDSKAEIG